jgi:hypothetical protein
MKNATCTHTTKMNLWNDETNSEQQTEVRTFWFDHESDANAAAKVLTPESRIVRVFSQPGSALGPFRVVSYRPA